MGSRWDLGEGIGTIAVEAVDKRDGLTRTFGTREPLFHGIDAVRARSRNSGSVNRGSLAPAVSRWAAAQCLRCASTNPLPPAMMTTAARRWSAFSLEPDANEGGDCFVALLLAVA